MNLPVKIEFSNNRYIRYIYDAAGTKWSKQIADSSKQVKTEHIGGFQYKAGKLLFFPTAEGYVKAVYGDTGNTPAAYRYVYTYKDHLGNNRLSYTLDPESQQVKILEENHYYPFGLTHPYNNTKREIKFNSAGRLQIMQVTEKEVSFKYYYQEQERQDELGLNWDSFKYRNYDYAIGRFMSIDPLAEKYAYNGVYNFSENRVLDGRELEGLEWESIKNKNGNTLLILKIQMYDESRLPDKQISTLKLKISNQFAESFSNKEMKIGAKLIIEEVTKPSGAMLVTLKEQTSTLIKDKNGKLIGRTYKGGKTGKLGETQKNSFEITTKIDGNKRNNTAIARSFSHEAGHTVGLRHPWSKKQNISDIKQGANGVSSKIIKANLMNTGANPIKANRSTKGTKLTKGQFKSIDELIRKQQ